MSNHTQGPWRSGDRFNTVFGPPNGNPAPQTIATVAKGNEADARLIAAAPELLAALRELLKIANDYSEEMRKIGRGHRELGLDAPTMSAAGTARAAIAKAEGRHE